MMVTVKAYPAVTDEGEAVCVAGMRLGLLQPPSWIRLFPVRFRDLPSDQQFHKYDIMRLRAAKASGDSRPESYTPDTDSIEVVGVVGPNRGWAERRKVVDQLVIPSMCWLLRQQANDGTSLGVFRPAQVLDVLAEPRPAQWSEAKQAALAQQSLFAKEKAELERIPYRFSYHYRCADPACATHTQGIIDWEIGEAWRSWHGTPEQRVAQIRRRWLDDLCGPKKDTHFFVGNMHLHPRSFLVLGVFWPPKP